MTITESDLLEFIRGSLKLKVLGADGRMGKTRGWDSLNQVMLMTALSGEYGIDIPPSMIGQLTSVSAILDYFVEQGLLGD